jgi:ketosteroid isomerase-like protein
VTKSLEQRIAELEDREAIRELLHAYCYLVDEGRVAECADLFTEDALADFHPLAVSHGIARIRRFFGNIPNLFSSIRHFVHNETIALDGDRARVSCYFEFKAVLTKGAGYQGAGQYDDNLVKADGRWRIKERKANFYFFLPENESWAQTERVKQLLPPKKG